LTTKRGGHRTEKSTITLPFHPFQVACDGIPFSSLIQFSRSGIRQRTPLFESLRITSHPAVYELKTTALLLIFLATHPS